MNENNRRVVVTGMGAITPVGNSVQECWQNLVAGKNGIGPITLFDTENYKAKLGAEVKNFNPLDYMEKSDMLRSDRYAQFAVAAASQAVEESGIEGKV
ncbi:MAG: beta-ketoacyl synthase N-terminal-like domain-containing protein, partial [Clostridia bacterium]|nr:beta-ketoacyl synthase N-terminal-like domain-containing protein [Clostridia bacterium]